MSPSDAVGAPGRPPRRPLSLAARILLVRLRFLAVPVVAFVLVASWPLLHNRWDKLTRTSAGRDLEAGGVSIAEARTFQCQAIVLR